MIDGMAHAPEFSHGTAGIPTTPSAALMIPPWLYMSDQTSELATSGVTTGRKKATRRKAFPFTALARGLRADARARDTMRFSVVYTTTKYRVFNTIRQKP